MRFTLFAVAVSCLMAVAMAGGASRVIGKGVGYGPIDGYGDGLWLPGYGGEDWSSWGYGADILDPWYDGYGSFGLDGYGPSYLYGLGKGAGVYYGAGKGVYGAGKGVYGVGKGVYGGKAGAAY